MSTCVCDWDPAEAYCKTTVVARKRHSCSECFGWIEPGESYERVWGKWDGSQDTFKTCPDCLALRDWTKAHVPCFCWSHGSMRDDAREVITDVCERNDVPGMWFEFGRLFVKSSRRKKERRRHDSANNHVRPSRSREL